MARLRRYLIDLHEIRKKFGAVVMEAYEKVANSYLSYYDSEIPPKPHKNIGLKKKKIPK